MLSDFSRHLLFCCGVLVCLACGSSNHEPESDGESEPIVIGLIAPLALNQATANGAILAMREINAAGGIEVAGHAHQLDLIVEDSEGRPENAVSKALTLINREKAAALVGLTRSFNAIPVARIAERHEVPMVSTMSTHPETTANKKYAFRLAFLDAQQGKTLATFAYQDLGMRRAAVLYDTAGPYSVNLAQVFRQSFEELGGRMVAFEPFTEDELDTTEHLLRIRDSGAEILFLPQRIDHARQHALQARELGLEVKFLGSDTWSHVVDPCEDQQLYGAYFTDFWAPGQDSEITRHFVAAYRQAFGAQPAASAALSYDAVTMIAAAIRQQGRAEGRAIRDGLNHLEPFRGVTGLIDFAGSGDPQRSVFIKRIEADGRVRLHREIEP